MSPAPFTNDNAPLLLFVDDDEPWSVLVRRNFLKLAPTWTFDHALDGRAALERIQATPPALIITDIQMPGMDGIQLLENLRSLPRTFPVVVMSNNANPNVRLRCTGLGIESFLDKPVTSEALRDSLQYVLDLTANFHRR